MKFLTAFRVCLVALIMVLQTFMLLIHPAQADTTTENITSTDGLSGSRVTTVDGNRTTVVDTLSGTDSLGAYVERTVTTVTIGNPTTSQTIKETETRYDKKGGKQYQTSTKNIARSGYNEAGGYSETRTVQISDVHFGREIISETTQRDAGGNIQSGTRTDTKLNDDGTKKSEKKYTYNHGDWELAQRRTTSPSLGGENSALASLKAPTNYPPMDRDPQLQPVQPSPGTNGGSASGVSLPPWAGAGSAIVVNVNPDEQSEGESGANGVILITEDQQGRKKLLQGKGSAGRLTILAALTYGTLKALELVTGFDKHGNAITGSRCKIGNPSHVEGTQPLAQVSPGSLAISEAESSAQPGDTMTLHIQGNNPLETRFMLDGQPVKTLGVSDDSALIQFDKSTMLAHHQLTMLSGNEQTKPLSITFVQLTPHPLPVSHPGVTEMVTIDVAGLAPSDGATMYFRLDGDAASIVGGATTAAIPVISGKAQLQIVGRHAGQILLHYRLIVKNPQFVTEM